MQVTSNKVEALDPDAVESSRDPCVGTGCSQQPAQLLPSPPPETVSLLKEQVDAATDAAGSILILALMPRDF